MSNRNSRIVRKLSRFSYLARTTYTANRDQGSMQAIVETDSSGTSSFLVTRNGTTVSFNGNEARTLFNLLTKHYEA